MRKFYLFKLGFLTSTLCNCGLQEEEFQIQNEIYGTNFNKNLKDLRTCLQNVSHKNKQEQNAIKSNQTTLTGDIAELKNKLTGEVNEINKLQQEIEALKKQKEELEGKASREALAELKTKLTEKVNEIEGLKDQLDQQNKALEDLKKQKDLLTQIENELTNKIDQSKLEEEIQKHTKELTEKVNEIEGLKKQLDQQNKTLDDLKEQKEELAKLKTELKNKANQEELEGKASQKDLEKLEDKIKEIDTLQQEIKEQVTKQYKEIQADFQQKIQTLGVAIQTIKNFLDMKPGGIKGLLHGNKEQKEEFDKQYSDVMSFSRRGTRANSFTRKSKPEQEKPSDDQYWEASSVKGTFHKRGHSTSNTPITRDGSSDSHSPSSKITLNLHPGASLTKNKSFSGALSDGNPPTTPKSNMSSETKL